MVPRNSIIWYQVGRGYLTADDETLTGQKTHLEVVETLLGLGGVVVGCVPTRARQVVALHCAFEHIHLYHNKKPNKRTTVRRKSDSIRNRIGVIIRTTHKSLELKNENKKTKNKTWGAIRFSPWSESRQGRR